MEGALLPLHRQSDTSAASRMLGNLDKVTNIFTSGGKPVHSDRQYWGLTGNCVNMLTAVRLPW